MTDRQLVLDVIMITRLKNMKWYSSYTEYRDIMLVPMTELINRGKIRLYDWAVNRGYS